MVTWQLPFRFWNATMGTQLPKKELDAVLWDATCPWTPGEIGCALSHRGVYEDFLRGQDLYAIVLEDDVRTTIAHDVLSSFLEEAGRWVGQQVQPTVLLLFQSVLQRRAVHIFTNGTGVETTRGTWGSHAYICNRAGAKLLRDLQTPLRLYADAWDSWSLYHGLRVYALDRMYWQGGELGESLIEKTGNRHNVERRDAFTHLVYHDWKQQATRRAYLRYLIRHLQRKLLRVEDNLKRAARKWRS